MNIESGDTTFVAELIHQNGGSPGGAFITNNFDVYSWVFLNTMNSPPVDGGDRIDIWQVEGRMDWFSFEFVSDTGRFEAKSGVINPEDFTDFILAFDATDLPMVMYAAEIHFWHNAAGLHDFINAGLDVFGPRPPTAFNLLSPADGDTLDSTLVDFTWQASCDPNAGEDVAYTFWFQTGEDSIGFNPVDSSLSIDIDTLETGLEYGSKVTWWVQAVGGEDTVECTGRFGFKFLPNLIDDGGSGIPVEFGLHSIHPNPFNSVATITFGADISAPARISVFDITGREVARLYDATAERGYHRVTWDASSVPSGLYLLRIESTGRARTRKIALLR